MLLHCASVHIMHTASLIMKYKAKEIDNVKRSDKRSRRPDETV